MPLAGGAVDTQARWSSGLAWLGLALVMIATRFPGLNGGLHLHDASWAVFFVAGFYLSGNWRWAFPTLLAVAVGVDYTAIKYYGISNYCLTWAYWFLVPAYGSLWLGGRWLRRHASVDVAGGIALVATAVISVSACFLISNGSFYWLGGRVPHPTLGGWAANFATWYGPFLRTAAGYIAIAAVFHVVIKTLLPRWALSA